MSHDGRTFLLALVASMALVSPVTADTTELEICHFPPGNPANFHTITIGASALPAHLAHGDFGGPCPNDCSLFGSICDDGDACTADTCRADGSCAHSSPMDCDDGNPCTADSCDALTGTCVNAPLPGTTTCDDHDVCTGPVDHCDPTGQCRGTPIAGCCTADATCNDDNACTVDTCDPATHTCTNATKTCTASDACHVASCAGDDGSCVEAPLDCDDADACTDDSCDPASGLCGHQTISCDDADPCTTDSCDPVAGCVHAPCPAGTTCQAGGCSAPPGLECPCWSAFDTPADVARFLADIGPACSIIASACQATAQRIQIAATVECSTGPGTGSAQLIVNTALQTCILQAAGELASAFSLSPAEAAACYAEALGIATYVPWCQ
jgi:hypothetical protein